MFRILRFRAFQNEREIDCRRIKNNYSRQNICVIFKFFKDKRNIVIFLLVILSGIKIPAEGNRFILWMLTGIFFSAGIDFFINRLFLKKTVFPKSAVITGFILSGILDYNQSFFLLVVLSSISIISKYILRFKRKHIFNPANLSLFLASFLHYPLTWTIESNVYIIVIVGLYLAYSLKKLPHIIGFLVVFILLFNLAENMNSFNIISWFFVFIMLIEPKTSGYGILRGFIFGVIAGLSSFLVFKFLPDKDFFVFSLFIANMFNPVFDKMFVRINNSAGIKKL